MNNFFIVFSLLCLLTITPSACSVSGCIDNNDEDNFDQLKQSLSVDVRVPDWIVNIPLSSNNIIGISRTSRNTDEMLDAAREMAAIQYARNLSSYNINNYVQEERAYTDTEYHDSRSFVFQVSDASKLHRIYDHLHLTDYYFLHNTFFVALFEFDDTREKQPIAIDPDRKFADTVKLNPTEPPEWYLTDEVKAAGNYFVSTAKASSSSLVNAWSEAAQQARILQSAYYSTLVSSIAESRHVNEHEQARRAVAVETLYNLRDISFAGSYIQCRFQNNNLIYTVFVKLRIKNYLTEDTATD